MSAFVGFSPTLSRHLSDNVYLSLLGQDREQHARGDAASRNFARPM
jgi:hypothetical protein